MVAIGLRFDESAVGRHPLARAHLPSGPALMRPRAGMPALAAARKGWEDRTRSEYQGMVAARHFHGILVELNAPLDIQELALTLALQEQKHARLCNSALEVLGGSGNLVMDSSSLRPFREEADAETRLWEFVLGPLAVSEVVAFRLLANTLRLLPRSGFRGILESILADEALHARFGLMILESVRSPRGPRWIKAPTEDWIREYVGSYLGACRRRDVIDPAEEALFADPACSRDLMRMGIPPSAGFKAIYFEALEKDVPRRFRTLGIELQRIGIPGPVYRPLTQPGEK